MREKTRTDSMEVRRTNTAPIGGHAESSPTREDFFRDLKKVVRKLPPDHPSRSDSKKR
jgi:hypothetical protein